MYVDYIMFCMHKQQNSNATDDRHAGHCYAITPITHIGRITLTIFYERIILHLYFR